MEQLRLGENDLDVSSINQSRPYQLLGHAIDIVESLFHIKVKLIKRDIHLGIFKLQASKQARIIY